MIRPTEALQLGLQPRPFETASLAGTTISWLSENLAGLRATFSSFAIVTWLQVIQQRLNHRVSFGRSRQMAYIRSTSKSSEEMRYE
jgi:hypothetical protein